VLGEGRKDPWSARAVRKSRPGGAGVTLEQVASTLKSNLDDPARVTFATLCRGWPVDLWPLTDPLSYLGKDGGGGIGSGPGLSVGAALALHTRGRHTISVLGDGDFAMGANALWTAVRHRIPLLMLINNNRSYYNDELHQQTVAERRGRNPANRWVGQRLADPPPNLAKLAEAQGAIGIGPVTDPGEVKSAVEQGVAVLKSGGVCVIDFHVTPGEERSAASDLGHRPTA
jgi:thiamine pyrophosphate-dependent acetolactate synthase large subunit-like protein